MDGDQDSIERQLQLMQRLMQARGRGGGGGADGNDLAQAMAMLSRGFGGGGGEGGGGPRGRARQAMAAILKLISNNADESEQYAGLLDLCNQLNMATEDTLAAIRPDSFVGPIAACLDKEHNPELMLLAARCLTYMVDAIPVTAVVLSSTNAVQILLNRLRVVVDVELSEQCLTCVDKIAQEAAGSILSNDGISAILGYVDFFSLSVQRRAWGTVASLCRRLKFDQWPQLTTALPQIRQAIVHEDQKICECAVLSLHRIVQAMHRDGERVAEVFHDAGVPVAEIIARGGCDGLFQAALQLTLAAITYAPSVAAGLIEVGFVGHLVALLETSASTNAGGTADQLSTPASRMSSSPQASPLANTTHVGSPPTSTPPRSTGGRFSETLGGSSNRKKALTPEMTKDACATLAALLPRISEGHMQYLNVLAALQASGQFNSLTQTRSDSGLADAMEVEVSAPSDVHGEEEDGEEEVDEEDEELAALRAELDELLMEQWVDIDNDEARHARCRPGRHSCNTCGAAQLAQNNWFRCNQCPDYDVCLSCLVHHGGEHSPEPEPRGALAALSRGGRGSRGGAGTPATPHHGRHTFTDMSEIQLRDPMLEATRRLINEAQSASPVTSNARIKSFDDAPYLLQRVAEALPCVIRLRLDTEHPRVQYYSLLFIARAVSFAPADDLRRILIDAPLCEAVVTALGERDLVSQVCGIYIAKELMQKLPDVYSALFAREGVTNALLRIKASCSNAVASSAPDSKRTSARSSPLQREDTSKQAGDQRLKELCSTPIGWQTVAATEAGELLNLFPALADATRSAEWDAICTLLREHHCADAFARINELICDASTFEVMNCSLFQDLRTAFQTAEIPVATVVDFVYSLSRGSSNSTTPVTAETDSMAQLSMGSCSNFTKFIRLLQSSLSQLENFKPMKFSPGLGVSSQIRLNIVPHNRDEYAAEMQKRTARRQLHHSDSGSLPTSPVSPHAPGAAATPGSEGRSAQVSIEPLASISGVADFIKGNLLPASRRGQSRAAAEGGNGAGGGDEDVVEDVLPPAADASTTQQRGTRQPSPASPTNGPPAVYIRLGRHALSPTWSMLQVMQRYGRSRTGSGSGSSSRSSGDRQRMLRDVPPELRALMEGPEAITLHYSTVPFGPDVRHPDACHPPHGAGSGGSPDDPITCLPIGESVITEGCTNIKHSIFATFEQSKRFMTPLMMHVLSLLGVFYNTVVFWDCVSLWLRMVGRPVEGLVSPTTNLLEFVNAKLNNKAMRHSANLLLAGQHLATWPVNLAMDCNFLFTSQTRKFLFDVSFFGTARSLVRIQEYLQETGNTATDALDASARRQHRLQRIKKRVWRDRALECATEVLNGQRGIGNSMLEFEFYGEEGSGLGPTLEFYTLVGDALRERKHQLWRASDEQPSDKYFNPVNGLFPRALPRDHPDMERMAKQFRVIGRYLARALLDKRIPNLRLSRPLVKIIRGDIVSFDQLQNINAGIFTVLRDLFVMCSASDGRCSCVKSVVTNVETLGLSFVLPGVDEIELVPGGAEIPVTEANALEYINRVTEFLLKSGIERLVVELRAGFHELVPLYALKALTIEELQALMDGHKAPSTLEELEAYCLADHGFSMSSQPVRWLLETVAEMEPQQQQRFFQFLTGSPYLPVGGLSCLRPRLTIVRKTTTDANVCEVQQLPSAMTCQNYLKLPAYESKEVLKQKLYQAVEEGCGVFLFT